MGAIEQAPIGDLNFKAFNGTYSQAALDRASFCDAGRRQRLVLGDGRSNDFACDVRAVQRPDVCQSWGELHRVRIGERHMVGSLGNAYVVLVNGCVL